MQLDDRSANGVRSVEYIQKAWARDRFPRILFRSNPTPRVIYTCRDKSDFFSKNYYSALFGRSRFATVEISYLSFFFFSLLEDQYLFVKIVEFKSTYIYKNNVVK